jgi:hypothetical protein
MDRQAGGERVTPLLIFNPNGNTFPASMPHSEIMFIAEFRAALTRRRHLVRFDRRNRIWSLFEKTDKLP